MILSAVQQSKRAPYEKVLLYAPEGWGKSTWGSKAERPIFLSTEDGLRSVAVDMFPEPRTWQDMFDAIETLRTENHDYKTLVIDTIDWAEHLCHAHLLKTHNETSVEKLGGGFGKWVMMVFEEFKRLIVPINRLCEEKQMNAVLLSHMEIKPYNNPTGENYDRFRPKLSKDVAGFLKEWAGAVLFGTYDVAVDVKSGQRKGKAYGQDRIIHTNYMAAFDAKNRHNLPDPISADPKEFWDTVKEEVSK